MEINVLDGTIKTLISRYLCRSIYYWGLLLDSLLGKSKSRYVPELTIRSAPSCPRRKLDYKMDLAYNSIFHKSYICIRKPLLHSTSPKNIV